MTPARILVVEDQRDVAEHLTRLRYAVLGITRSGEEAVRHTTARIAILPIGIGHIERL
jgi:hypothetical protein